MPQHAWTAVVTSPMRCRWVSSAAVRKARLRVSLGELGTIAAAAVTVTGLYAWSFRGPIHLLPSDPFSYAWQFRAIREGLLGSVDPRPGTAVVGAMLEGFGVLPDTLAPTLLGIALLAVIGLSVAAITRRALGLPTWACFPIAVGAATFGGTAKLTGYVANLVALACFSAGLTAVLASRSRPWRGLLAATAAFLAACLAHPALIPAWVAIVGGWFSLAVLWWLIVRWTGGAETSRPFDRRPLFASIALALGAIGALAIVLGALDRSLSELGNLSTARPFFGERLADTWDWIKPTVGLSVLGLVLAVWRGRRSGERTGQLLLIGWIGVTLGGVVLMAVSPGFPGHRTLMLAIPLGAAAGLVAVEIVLRATRHTGRRSIPAIVEVAAAVTIGLVLVTASGFLGVLGFGAGASSPWRERAIPSRQVAAYARAHPPDVPLIMVFEPQLAEGARHWKVRMNVARSFLDGRRAAGLFIYVGDPKRLLARQPSVYPGTADPLEQALNRISARTWPDVMDAIDRDADIVIPRRYVRPRSWKFLLANGAERSGPDLAVIGGTPMVPITVPSFASIPMADGWMAAVISVFLLGLIGGVGILVSGNGGGSPGDAVIRAPAFGVVVMVLVGTGIALAGGDPGAPAPLAAIVIVGVGSWLVQLFGMSGRAAGRAAPPTATRPATGPPTGLQRTDSEQRSPS